MLKSYTELYGRDEDEITPGGLLEGIIRRANRQTGKQVVVIVDEYDAPLLDVLHKDDVLEEMRAVMQEFYQPLKACESLVRFCFITGVTKFSQLSIFSTINNIKNVSLLPRFSAICGFTEQEVRSCFDDDMKRMAEQLGCSPEDMFLKIKERYDGYHFSESSEDLYNPYSLLNAFADGKLDNYWFATGTPTFLVRQLQHYQTDITAMEQIDVPSSAFDQPTENMQDALPLLYQSGYLTIKSYDKESQVYSLSIPNQEVRVGYTEGLLREYVGLRSPDVQTGFALKFWRALKQNDIHLALTELQAYFAGLPYIEGFKKKLADVSKAEGFYEWTFYLVFSMLNVYVRTQVKTIQGRIDVVVYMPDAIYVMELKINGTAQEALDQINRKGYAIPYAADGRMVIKVGIRFSTEKLNVEDWVVQDSADNN